MNRRFAVEIDTNMDFSDVIDEDNYINEETKIQLKSNVRGLMNRRTFEYLKKFYTRPNKTETSKNYKTYFPGLKFYHALSGAVDSIRIHKDVTDETEIFFWIRNHYFGSKGDYFRCVCIYPGRSDGNIKSVRGISSVIPSGCLIEIAKKETSRGRQWPVERR